MSKRPTAVGKRDGYFRDSVSRRISQCVLRRNGRRWSSDVLSQAEVISIWTTECEEADKHGACGGVGCFDGICWRAYTRQLMAIEQVAPRIGVQCYYKAFDRDLERYGESAGWVRFALETFQVMPPKRDGVAIPADRFVAVVQAWNVTAAEEQAQIVQAQKAGANGYLLATFEIEQDWEPQAWKRSDLQARSAKNKPPVSK